MNDALYHHGVKGMRWGVRKTPDELQTDSSYNKMLKTKYKEISRPKSKTVRFVQRQLLKPVKYTIAEGSIKAIDKLLEVMN